jgi:hypothetical protein
MNFAMPVFKNAMTGIQQIPVGMRKRMNAERRVRNYSDNFKSIPVKIHALNDCKLPYFGLMVIMSLEKIIAHQN